MNGRQKEDILNYLGIGNVYLKVARFILVIIFHFNWFKWQLMQMTGAHYLLRYNLHP